MPNKTKDYVDMSMSAAQSMKSNLQQAVSKAEKAENKEKIQQAMNAIDTACNCLSSYKD